MNVLEVYSLGFLMMKNHRMMIIVIGFGRRAGFSLVWGCPFDFFTIFFCVGSDKEPNVMHIEQEKESDREEEMPKRLLLLPLFFIRFPFLRRTLSCYFG